MTRHQSSALFLLLVLPVWVSAAAPYSKIFYFRNSPEARAALFAHYQNIDILAPQSYALNKNGELEGGLNPAILLFAREHGIQVMPLVTNKLFNPEVSQALLADTLKQDQAIKLLVTEAVKYGYSGWQIDFEQMDLSDRDKFSNFIKQTAEIFKQNNLLLSVAVVAKVSDNPSDYPKTLWPDLIGVYDYAALAAGSDFITVMSYDDPESPGPSAGLPWVRRVLDYSLTKIPAHKLSLGLGLYYWLRNDATGKVVEIGGNSGIQSAFQKHKITIHFSQNQQVPYLEYWKNAKSYTLWYENKQSIAKKIDLIKQYHLRGFSAWALGLEHPSVYQALDK